MPFWLILLLSAVGFIFSWMWLFCLIGGSRSKFSDFIVILGFIIIIAGLIALIVYLFKTLIIFKLLTYFSLTVSVISLFIFGYNAFVTLKRYPLKDFFRELFDGIVNSLYSFNEKAAFICLCIALVGVVVTNSAVQQWVGVGDIRLKPEGTYCYYVQHDDNYFPAKVRVEKEPKSNGDDDVTITRYYVDQIIFSKKSQPKFDCDPVELDEEEYLYTEDGDIIKVVLLNRTAKSPYIKETNNATAVDVTFLCIELFAVIICLIPSCKDLFGSKD